MTRLYDPSGNRKYLNPSERITFFQTIETIDNLAEKTFCLVLVYTGCRISEALNLRIKNIDPSEQTLTFKTLKQRSRKISRVLPVHDELIDLLQQQAKASRGTRIWNFSRWKGWRIIKHYMDLAGLDGIKATPKGLRHAFAIDNLTENAPLTAIQKWLGHAKLETTQIYLDYVGAEERELIAKSWPHRKMLPPVSVTPVTTVTEIESFDFGASDMQDLNAQMNASISKREAEGWEVKQIEHVKKYAEDDGEPQPYTAGMMVFFVYRTKTVRHW